MKCAPGKGDGVTCFSHGAIMRLARAYNEKHKDNPIKLTHDKHTIHRELKKRLKNTCNENEKCWITQPFARTIKDEEIHKRTFLPSGPSRTLDWLSTTHIDEAMYQMRNLYSDFHFLGAVPMDFDDERLSFLGIRDINFGDLYQRGYYRLGIVFNTDESWKPGQHWVAAFIHLEKRQVYYFDSVGMQPEKRVRFFLVRALLFLLRKHRCAFEDIDIMYNYRPHQRENTECGVYCINWLRRILRGETFLDIIESRMGDDEVSKCRKVYFE